MKSARRHVDISREVTVYRPNQRHELGLFSTWAVMAGNIWNARDLIMQLFKRDFFARFKKSFLGFTWVFIAPILGVISWVFLQKTGMLQPGDVGIPYPAYVLFGMTMWSLFMGFYGAASQTLASGKYLVMQVNYPHEALLFKQTAQHLANFVLNFIVNIIVLAAFRVFPTWGIIVFPFVALPLFFLGVAMGMMSSMIGVVAVDVNKAIGILMGMLIWITPLIYSDRIENRFVQVAIKWNPLTYLVCSCRDIVIYGRLYNTAGYFICALASFVLFLLSWRLFYVSEQKIIERMV